MPLLNREEKNKKAATPSVTSISVFVLTDLITEPKICHIYDPRYDRFFCPILDCLSCRSNASVTPMSSRDTKIINYISIILLQ